MLRWREEGRVAQVSATTWWHYTRDKRASVWAAHTWNSRPSLCSLEKMLRVLVSLLFIHLLRAVITSGKGTAVVNLTGMSLTGTSPKMLLTCDVPATLNGTNKWGGGCRAMYACPRIVSWGKTVVKEAGCHGEGARGGCVFKVCV